MGEIDREAIMNAARRQVLGLERARSAYETERARYARMLAGIGLEEPEFLTLLFAARSCRTILGLSRSLEIDRARVLAIVRRLSDRGLLSLRGGNRKYWRIWPTDAGWALVKSTLELARALDGGGMK